MLAIAHRLRVVPQALMMLMLNSNQVTSQSMQNANEEKKNLTL